MRDGRCAVALCDKGAAGCLSAIGVLESEVAKSKDYLDRVQQHDARNVAGALDLG